MHFKYINNICHLRIPLEESRDEPPDPLFPDDLETLAMAAAAAEPMEVDDGDGRAPIIPVHKTKRIVNIKKCDIFIDGKCLILFVDVKKFVFNPKHTFDINKIDKLVIKYKTAERVFELELPCLPPSAEPPVLQSSKGLVRTDIQRLMDIKHLRILQQMNAPVPIRLRQRIEMNFAALKRLTDVSELKIDEKEELVKFEGDFAYGFGSTYTGKLLVYKGDNEPSTKSPVQRLIDSEIEEAQNFSEEQYKNSFIARQLPGLGPKLISFSIDYTDARLDFEQLSLLRKIIITANLRETSDHYRQIDIHYGLINILLAILYDIRCTENKPDNESCNMRQTISATLSHFVPFDNLRDCLVSFIRRVVTFGAHRNYEFAVLCISDCSKALMYNNWVLKQLLLTHQMFSKQGDKGNICNLYFIEDYVRYLCNSVACTTDKMQVLCVNIKNVMYDLSKRSLRMNLKEIESKAFKDFHAARISGVLDHVPSGSKRNAGAIASAKPTKTEDVKLGEVPAAIHFDPSSILIDDDSHDDDDYSEDEDEVVDLEEDEDEDEDDEDIHCDLHSSFYAVDDDDDEDNEDDKDMTQSDAQDAEYGSNEETIDDHLEVVYEDNTVSEDNVQNNSTADNQNDSMVESIEGDDVVENANDSNLWLNVSNNVSSILSPISETAESSFSSSQQQSESSPMSSPK